MAWLNTAPRPRQRRGAKADSSTSTTARTTRLKQMMDEGTMPQLPDAGPAAYLVGYLLEAGPVQYTGMGPAPLSWAELQLWQAATATPLQPWEARTLRRLSSDYLAASQEAEDPDCPPPCSDEPTPDQRDLVARKLKAAFGGNASVVSVRKGH